MHFLRAFADFFFLHFVSAAARCPVLAVRAVHSEIVTADGLAEFRAAVPQVELAEIADAHHHVMLDQPAALARVLGDFLDRHR